MPDEKRKSRKRLIVLIAAIVTIIVVVCTGILIFMTTMSWRKAVRAGNEAVAVSDMRTIVNDERIFYLDHRSYGTFEQLIASGMLDSRFNGNPPIVNGYVFMLKVAPATRNQTTSYTFNADPETDHGYNATGTRHFYADSTNAIVRVNDFLQPASANDPPIK